MLDALAARENNILVELAETAEQIAEEEQIEEDVIREINEIDEEIEKNSSFEEILQNQIVDARKELFNVNYKIKEQNEIYHAYEELNSALKNSPIKFERSRMSNSQDESSEIAKRELKLRLKEQIRENYAIREKIESLLMKKNVQESEKLRILDYLKICLKSISKMRSVRSAINKKYKPESASINELTSLIENKKRKMKQKRKNISKSSEFLNKSTDIEYLSSYCNSNNLLDYKRKEYEMRTKLSTIVFEQAKAIIKSINKGKMDSKGWNSVLDELIFQFYDSRIENISLLLN